MKGRLIQWFIAKIFKGVTDKQLMNEHELSEQQQKAYFETAASLAKNKVFLNEVAKLIHHHEQNILRKTRNDMQIAFNRGALYALDKLLKRVVRLSARSQNRYETID